MDYLFFFYVFVYFYLFQFVCFYFEGRGRVLCFKIGVGLSGGFGFVSKFPLRYVVMSLYFFFMFFVCYFGHFSWNLAFGRMLDFVLIWSLVAWFMGVMILLSEEVVSNVLGLYGEKFLGVLYSVWGKLVSILVRPLSLSLRLFINLSVGHFFMRQWVLNGFGYSFIVVQLLLTFIVLYEMFVFFLQSFIFSRLLEVYLEEGFTNSIRSMIVLRSIGCF